MDSNTYCNCDYANQKCVVDYRKLDPVCRKCDSAYRKWDSTRACLRPAKQLSSKECTFSHLTALSTWHRSAIAIDQYGTFTQLNKFPIRHMFATKTCQHGTRSPSQLTNTTCLCYTKLSSVTLGPNGQQVSSSYRIKHNGEGWDQCGSPRSHVTLGPIGQQVSSP